MTRYILDTDHLSLLQRRHPQVSQRYAATPKTNLFITAITAEEQIRGRLALIGQFSQKIEQLPNAYQNLITTLAELQQFTCLSFTSQAAQLFLQLRQEKVRIGSQDLKIATIALTESAILVTRNQRDFRQVPNLKIEDWTIP